MYANWRKKPGVFQRRKLLTPWPVRASISFSISGQCWGHSLFIISTVIRDKTSLMWLSSSRIERVPWWEQNWYQYTVYDYRRKIYVRSKTDDHTNTSMLLSYIHLIKAAWHTPLNGLSLAAACCSIWTCKKKQTSFLATLLPLTWWSLLCLIREENIRLTWLRAPGFANQSVSQQLAELCQLIVSHMGRRESCSL